MYQFTIPDLRHIVVCLKENHNMFGFRRAREALLHPGQFAENNRDGESQTCGRGASLFRIMFGDSDMLESRHEFAVDDDVAEESVKGLDAYGDALSSV